MSDDDDDGDDEDDDDVVMVEVYGLRVWFRWCCRGEGEFVFGKCK